MHFTVFSMLIFIKKDLYIFLLKIYKLYLIKYYMIKNPSEYEKGKTIVYLVRHGDYISDKSIPRFPGSGLSKKGKSQARKIAKSFEKIKNQIDIFYTSPMTRAKQTSEFISKKINKKHIEIKEFSEYNKFLWKRKILHKNFWKHYHFHRKSLTIFNKILRKHKGKVILISAHGNMIKGLIGKKLGLSLRQIEKINYDNCHLSKLRFLDTKLDFIYYINSADLIPL